MHSSTRLAGLAGALLLACAGASHAALPKPTANFVVMREARGDNIGLTMVDVVNRNSYPLTGASTQNTADNWTAWSGDGKRLAYVREGSDSKDINDNNGSGLYIYNLQLQREFRMTTSHRGVSRPVWGSPKQLAFTALVSFGGDDRTCVFAYTDIPNRSLKRLFCNADHSLDMPGIIDLRWSADRRYLYAVDLYFTWTGLESIGQGVRTMKIDVQTGKSVEVGKGRFVVQMYDTPSADPFTNYAIIAPDTKDTFYGIDAVPARNDWTSLVTGEYVTARYPYAYPVYSNNSQQLAGADGRNVVVSNRDGSAAVRLGQYPDGVRVLDWSANDTLLAVKSGTSSSVLRVDGGTTIKPGSQYAFGDGQLWFKPGSR